MNCNYHPSQEAQSLCEKCKRPICPECTLKIDDKTICRHCIQQTLFSEPETLPRKSLLEKFLFFCLSLIPGAAHMQMGLFRRGLQLMVIPLGVICVSDYIGLNVLIPLVLIPTWFFSFFESHNLKKQQLKGLSLSDEDLFNRQLFDYTLLLKNRRIIGVIVIVIGCLSLSHVMERYSIFVRLFGNWNNYYMLRSSFVPFCLILGGIYLIIKAKQPAKTGVDISDDH
ncbi:B-box zinc finger protein [Desulfosporosinus sp. SB140]|uniref:B-box zinc finger protein n=1 Tax=Desulfosporosinus paludis TaxID=3115649 RepID=UPI003890ABBF